MSISQIIPHMAEKFFKMLKREVMKRPWKALINSRKKNRCKFMKRQANNVRCPLCRDEGINPFIEDKNREYLSCGNCELVFVPEQFWLSSEEEKAVYDLHENGPEDAGYRKFLSRLTTPLMEKLDPNQEGLDFGCGPGPGLSVILEEEGYHVDLYDKFYFDDFSVLKKSYDFICSTEVVEHLHDPDKTFDMLFNMLKTGGHFGIMTKLVINKDAFRKWHYIRDITHICFYRRATFEYIAQRFSSEITILGNDVILLKKRSR